MTGVHQPSHLVQITGGQCLHSRRHPLVLAYDVATAPMDYLRKQSTVFFQLGAGHVPQGGDAGQNGLQSGDAFLALGAALVVGAAGQGAAGLCVADDQRRPLREGNPLVFQGAAVDEQGVALLAQGADELVHNSTVDAHKDILRVLGRFGNLGARERIGGIRRAEQGQDVGDFQASRTAQPATPGDIAAHYPFQTDQPDARLFQCPGHAHCVIGPENFVVKGQIVQLEVGPGVEFHRVETHPPVSAGAKDNPHILVQSHRQDESVVVVRVFADEIDPARRNRHVGRLAVKNFGEFGANFFGSFVEGLHRVGLFCRWVKVNRTTVDWSYLL